jgi:hypothetical protein
VSPSSVSRWYRTLREFLRLRLVAERVHGRLFEASEVHCCPLTLTEARINVVPVPHAPQRTFDATPTVRDIEIYIHNTLDLILTLSQRFSTTIYVCAQEHSGGVRLGLSMDRSVESSCSAA